MKYLKNIQAILGVGVFLILYSTGCTSEFEDFNTNPYGATDEQLAQDWKNIGGNFYTMQRGIMHWTHWKYQLQQNLNGDVYSQFLIPPTPFGGNVNNVTYGFNEGWNLWPWKLAFEDVMTPALLVEQIIGDDEVTQHWNAWAKILKVYAMHRVCDIHGPIVYSKFGTVDVNIPYDTQKEAYYLFFDELKSAVDILTPFADDSNTSFADFDLTYGGDMKKWIKAANSLRLRLAMRLAQVDPVKAKEEFEAALSHKYGVLSGNEDNFFVDLPESHPVKTIGLDWLDTRMSAPMESYLKGYNDPRIEAYFRLSTVSGDYHGIRQGIQITSKSQYQDEASAVSSWFESNQKMQIFTYAEICFLKAEGVLRGWDVGEGSAEEQYIAGVKASFDQWGVGSADAYLEDDASTAAEFFDPIGNTENDVTASSGLLSTATIKWDNSGTNEQKLEKVMTQKWIALFPDGQEAWSEFRRTDYPKLFPVVVNYSGGEIPAGHFVKRLKFSRDEYSNNASEVDKAVDMIGGNDGYNVRLWWDVSDDVPNNF